MQASPSDNETSHAVALASDSKTAVDTVKESPTDALMRMAGVERVIVGSDGRSYAVVSVNGKADCRELKSKALRNLLTHAALKATGKLPTPEAIAAVVGVLEANAEFDGTHEDVFLRVARCLLGLLISLTSPTARDGSSRFGPMAGSLWQSRRSFSAAPPGSFHCPLQNGAVRLSS